MWNNKINYQPQGKIIGLTGGVAVGKSSITNLLRDYKIPVVDFDQLVKKVRSLPEVQEKLLKIFGTTDRIRLREIVFQELVPNAKQILNQEVGFRALLMALQESENLFSQGHKKIVWEAALLVETETFMQLDAIILVCAKETLRLERLQERDNISKDLAQKMINSQMSDDVKKNKIKLHPYNLVIDNNNDLNLNNEISRILDFITAV